MFIEGTGGALGAVEILDTLGFHRLSGVFQIVSDGDEDGFQVLAGKLIFATSSQRTLRLGHLLLQRGSVEPMYLHDILKGRRTITRDRALGGALIADRAVSREDLADGVKEQAIEVLSRIMALSEATYLLHSDEPLPAGIEIVPLDTQHLLSEAAERHLSRESTRVMQRLLPPVDARLHLTVQLALVSYALTDAELLVALRVDRVGTTLQRLGETLLLDPLTLRRSVISLLERGYIARCEDELRFDP